jgi:aminoglycoside phosphotransferase (APT) family kinase protein
VTESAHEQARSSPVVTSSASWAPERVVDRDQAEQLIGRTFPELRGQPVRPLAEGWDNSVFLVGEELVFRFPRRAMALPGIRREIAVLPVIAPLVPLPIPTPSYVGVDDYAEDPWPFFGARLVPGTELAVSALSDAERVRAAEDAGAFLRALHAPETLAAVQNATADPLPHDPMHRAWPRARITDTRHLLETLANDGAWTPDGRVVQLLENANALDAPWPQPKLMHGDLHIRHLLVDTTESGPGATGVIDWGDLCMGDPAMDLSLGYAAFAGQARNAFFHAYGDIDAERELRARALAIRLSATLAAYALATGQDELAAESLRGLHRAVV